MFSVIDFIVKLMIAMTNTTTKSWHLLSTTIAGIVAISLFWFNPHNNPLIGTIIFCIS